MSRVWSWAAAAALVVAGVLVVESPAQAADPANTVPPSIIGKAQYDQELKAVPGEWTPPVTEYGYQWLRDGQPIDEANGSTHRAGLEDLGNRLSVVVTASDGAGGIGTATSAETAPVARKELRAKRGQKVAGVARYTHTLVARAGRWNTEPTRIRYQWRRGGKEIKGATEQRFEIRPQDVGSRVRVAITVKAPGHTEASVVTDPQRVRHRVDVQRVVRYHIETRGQIATSLKEFAAQAQETFDDPRGWRAAGIQFRRVPRGGGMTLVLAAASTVPGFSSGCSSMWSCRVGRFVIINQERWKHASPAWNAANGALRGYRHMVVNHETGHWLGLGHASCPGPGRAAPVMMQQSKGLNGCHFNPFPTLRELASRTPSGRAMAGPAGAGYARVDLE